MANPVLQKLTDQVEVNKSVEGSAKVLIDGFGARLQAAVDAALANGATEAELAPVQAEVDALAASSADLAASVAANTPAA